MLSVLQCSQYGPNTTLSCNLWRRPQVFPPLDRTLTSYKLFFILTKSYFFFLTNGTPVFPRTGIENPRGGVGSPKTRPSGAPPRHTWQTEGCGQHHHIPASSPGPSCNTRSSPGEPPRGSPPGDAAPARCGHHPILFSSYSSCGASQTRGSWQGGKIGGHPRMGTRSLPWLRREGERQCFCEPRVRRRLQERTTGGKK